MKKLSAIIIIVVSIGSAISCRHETSPATMKFLQRENMATDTSVGGNPEGEDVATTRGKTIAQYGYSNDSLVQTLSVEWVEEHTIQFTLSVENGKANCRMKLSGMASNLHIDSDPEIDEEENGEAYPSIEYLYKDDTSDCELFIRIAMDNDKVVIKSADCRQQSTCPLKSMGILRIQQ
jgi:hypothetical protein